MAVSQVRAQINGQWVTLTHSSGDTWEVQTTSPNLSSYNQPDHYYAVTIEATDDAGNKTTATTTTPDIGEDLKLRVLEKVAPTITIVSPTADSVLTTSEPQFNIQLRDADSGVDISTLVIKVDAVVISSSSYTPSQVSGGYNVIFNYTLTDGPHTLYVDVSDNDGNAATQAVQAFKVDTVPPQLSITTPTEGYVTNQSTLIVTGTTNDSTSSPVTVAIKVNEVDVGTVTVESTGEFSKEVTLTNGVNVITITATDSAGKSSTVTRNVTLDTGVPVITNVEIIPNPVDCGATYTIRVTVTDN